MELMVETNLIGMLRLNILEVRVQRAEISPEVSIGQINTEWVTSMAKDSASTSALFANAISF